jgi:hypothetical protein
MTAADQHSVELFAGARASSTKKRGIPIVLKATIGV